jgi:hypothetical protein
MYDTGRLPFTSTTSPATIGNWKEQHMYSTNKKQGKGEKQIRLVQEFREDIKEPKVEIRKWLCQR